MELQISSGLWRCATNAAVLPVLAVQTIYSERQLTYHSTRLLVWQHSSLLNYYTWAADQKNSDMMSVHDFSATAVAGILHNCQCLLYHTEKTYSP
jgi:hypothetical protein